MANIEMMVPHILKWEVGLRDGEDKLGARELYGRVSVRGFHKVAGDRGGATMCGVTIGTFTDWRRRKGGGKPTEEDLKKLGFDEWLSIMKELFWDPCKGDSIENASVAMMLVDWRWVNGTQAVRDAQSVLSCVADGIVGPKTLAALNEHPASGVFARLKAARERSYRRIVERRPDQKKFLKGWLNRTGSISFKG
ncbi:peptidoglycan domain protein [bacterium]|nr:peptidoglycan domain protein [Bacteroidales bacterium]MBD5401132.1 peptidoglycan domain protein [bacterium]